MAKQPAPRPSWKSLLSTKNPLLLPTAHDALTAKLIAQAGFVAYQVGGFALNGSRHGIPDLDLTHFGEERPGVRDIMEASTLPVMIDADDGYGDVKNVFRTVRGYEAMGASAIFIEDQVAPKRCGHIAGKSVVPTEVMVGKIRTAVGVPTLARLLLPRPHRRHRARWAWTKPSAVASFTPRPAPMGCSWKARTPSRRSNASARRSRASPWPSTCSRGGDARRGFRRRSWVSSDFR